MGDTTLALLSGTFGAAASLVGSWFLVPKLERRTRAQQTWEQHVFEAGRFLSEEVPRLRREAYRAWRSWSTVGSLRPGLLEQPHVRDRPDAEEAVDEYLDEVAAKTYTEAVAAYDAWQEALLVRMRWLGARLQRHRNDHKVIDLRMRHEVLVSGLSPYMWTSHPNVDTEPVEERWRLEAERMKALRQEVERLASTIEAFPLNRLTRAWRWISARVRKTKKAL
jgi:hypothetical protein